MRRKPALKSWPKWLTAAVVLALAVLFIRTQILLGRLRAEHLTALNLAARADTTSRVVRDSLATSRRQVEQLQVTLNQRTHERDEHGQALADLQVRFDQVSAKTTGTVTASAPDTLTVQGHLDARATYGLQLDAAAVVAVTPRTATWSWSVDRSPLPLEVDFSCRRDTALVHVTGPTWANVNISRAQQSDRFCNPPPPAWNPFALRLPSLPVAAALVALGWLVHR